MHLTPLSVIVSCFFVCLFLRNYHLLGLVKGYTGYKISAWSLPLKNEQTIEGNKLIQQLKLPNMYNEARTFRK